MYRGAVCAVPPCFSRTCSPQQLFLARSITGPPPAISCRCSRVSYSVLRSCLSPSGRSLKAASPFLSFIASVDQLYPCALSLSSKTSSFFPSRGPSSDKFQKTGGRIIDPSPIFCRLFHIVHMQHFMFMPMQNTAFTIQLFHQRIIL